MGKFSKTNLFKYEIVQFMKRTILTVGSNTYVGIGRPLYWGDSASSETADEVGDVELSADYLNTARRNMIAIKKIAPSDIALVVGRNDWKSGTVYEQYNDHLDLFSHIKRSTVGFSFANSNTTITGTANTSPASSIVFGANTLFVNFLTVGDVISINNQTRSVVTITNNQHLVVNTEFTFGGVGNNIVYVANNRVVKNTSGVFSGNVDVGSIVSLGKDTKEVIELRNQYTAVVNSKFEYSHVGNTALIKLTDRYPLFANNYYVRNSRDQVFKCLYTPIDNNNTPIPSTIEPTIDIDGQLPEEAYIETGDLYKWKYLYTIPYGLKLKFFTNKWMPVISENSVVEASQDGRIDIIDVKNGGSGYYLAGGQSGNNSSLPIVTITGDGTGATATAQVESGIITELNILNGGANYTKATVTINDPDQLATGTDAEFDVVISPPGGHGSDPAKELGCFTFMISAEIEGTEGGKFPISGSAYGGDFDFRQIQLIRDPLHSNGVFASGDSYITSYQFDVSDPGASNYINDEIVYVGASLASANLKATVASFDVSLNRLYLIDFDGDFSSVVGSEIKGNSSAAAGAILGITEPEVDLFSGDTLYIENRLPVVRNLNQTEQIRLVFSF